MAVFSLYVSRGEKDGAALDGVLRGHFSDIHQVADELWLVDTARDADAIVTLLRPHLSPADRLFVAAITRNFFPLQSEAALSWLTAPARSWGSPRPASPPMPPPAFASEAA